MSTPYKSLLDYNQREHCRPATDEEYFFQDNASVLELRGPTLDKLPSIVKEDIERMACYKIGNFRLKMAGITASPAVHLMIAILANTPGKIVSWAYTLKCIARKHNIQHIGLTQFLDEFQNGWPSEETHRTVWNAQKIGGANGYDTIEAWK